jgi:hypothetical protein
VYYVAGPYRAGTPWLVEQNIRRAEFVSLSLWQHGIPNVCPHTQGRFFDKEIPDDIILDGMKAVMLTCHGVVVLPGWEFSKGTREEIEVAVRAGMRVHYLRNFDDVNADIVRIAQDNTHYGI